MENWSTDWKRDLYATSGGLSSLYRIFFARNSSEAPKFPVAGVPPPFCQARDGRFYRLAGLFFGI